MTNVTPFSDDPKRVERDHRAEIVGRLYDVALDPIRLEDLRIAWERYFALLRPDAWPPPDQTGAVFADPEIEAHLDRAAIFLDRYVASRDDGAYRSVLEDIPRAAAFLSDGGPILTGFNRPAAVAFGLRDGAALVDLPFEAEDLDMLRDVIRKVASGRAERVVTLRLRSSITGSPVIVRVGSVEGEIAKPLALVMSTELVWPEGFELTVQEAFGLTIAEVEIVRGITLGLPVKDIAEARGRSAETVRTQLRSILAKTETHSQSELVRVVLGLTDLASMPSEAAPAAFARSGNLDPLVYQHIKGRDGRRLEFIEFGNPAGRPVLYMHCAFGLIRWPASAERVARQRNLRVIVPVRAGYGRSDSQPRDRDHLQGVTEDYLAILDWLGIRRVGVLALGADLRFALSLARQRPDLVGGILGCGALLPLQAAAQYDRLETWPRFLSLAARFNPKLVPFLVQAGFSVARRIGKENCLARISARAPADLETFNRPEVREALLAGSEVSLSEKILAHQAFASECVGAGQDWSDLLGTAAAPVILLHGDQDPLSPAATMQELAAEHPQLDLRMVAGAGQLLFFSHWPVVLDLLEKFLPRR